MSSTQDLLQGDFVNEGWAREICRIYSLFWLTSRVRHVRRTLLLGRIRVSGAIDLVLKRNILHLWSTIFSLQFVTRTGEADSS